MTGNTFASCATYFEKPVQNIADKKKYPKLNIQKLEIIKGEVLKVNYDLKLLSDFDLEEAELYCNKKRVGFDIKKYILRTFVAYDYNLEANQFNCKLKIGHDFSAIIFSIKNKPFYYPTKNLNVPKRHAQLKPKDLKRWLKEQELLKSVYGKSIYNYALFNKPFSKPLKSKITAVYGSKRVFNNSKKSWHSGVDLRARRPTPIPSVNRGKVVLVHHLFFNGKTVIVDHGLGIFSMYCHMSSYDVNVGDMVKKSDIVGKTGNTGRSNAPHLHWGMRVNENWVNGLNFVKQGI